MYASITMTIDLPVYPERVYRAWLDAYEHSRFTGKPAHINPGGNDAFEFLEGGVKGKVISLSPFDRIVQSWQMTDFPMNSPDSKVEFKLEPTCTGTEFSLIHNGIESTQTRRMMQWWDENYLRPLWAYFNDIAGDIPADEGDG